MYQRFVRWQNIFGNSMRDAFGKAFFHKNKGIDGILVTVGLCIIALLLCVVMKDRLAQFIETIVTSLTTKATGILGGT